MQKQLALVCGVLFSSAAIAAPPAPPVKPFEQAEPVKLQNAIDVHVLKQLKANDITPAHLCSEEVFFRRVHIDVIGTVPRDWQIRDFLKNKDPKKRAKLIDQLLNKTEFADYWALKWCDLLRVKAEFPINLWPNGAQAYHRWIHRSITDNKPYDQFARELLTSSGSNFRVPPVNFYRAMQGKAPSTIAASVALTFMGERIENWPQHRRENMELFFSRVAFKPTAEWKEEIVHLDPAVFAPLDATLPNGQRVHIKAGQDPRHVFADWLITDSNLYFSRNIANRVWAWLIGRGIIHEPDDAGGHNPPINPELLTYLQNELVQSDYNLKHLFRLILNSRTYQQSSISQSNHPRAEAMFAHYIMRRLEAEVLIDALVGIFGPTEKYSSMVPEPFTFIPEEHRTITLADGSISSSFLELFGRPARDTGYENERNNHPTDAQRMHMLNSTHIQKKITRSWRVRDWMRKAKGDTKRLTLLLYANILTRRPTSEEEAVAVKYLKNGGRKNLKNNTHDLAWALVNSKEFMFRH